MNTDEHSQQMPRKGTEYDLQTCWYSACLFGFVHVTKKIQGGNGWCWAGGCWLCSWIYGLRSAPKSFKHESVSWFGTLNDPNFLAWHELQVLFGKCLWSDLDSFQGDIVAHQATNTPWRSTSLMALNRPGSLHHCIQSQRPQVLRFYISSIPILKF